VKRLPIHVPGNATAVRYSGSTFLGKAL
jgi:hypothetical protein